MLKLHIKVYTLNTNLAMLLSKIHLSPAHSAIEADGTELKTIDSAFSLNY